MTYKSQSDFFKSFNSTVNNPLVSCLLIMFVPSFLGELLESDLFVGDYQPQVLIETCQETCSSPCSPSGLPGSCICLGDVCVVSIHWLSSVG